MVKIPKIKDLGGFDATVPLIYIKINIKLIDIGTKVSFFALASPPLFFTKFFFWPLRTNDE